MSIKTTAGVLIALIALLGVFYYVSTIGAPKPPPPPKPRATLSDMWPEVAGIACKPARGNPKASWTVIELGDFQCPICGRSRKYVEALIDQSGGQAKMYFCNYPLDMHIYGRPAATASIAAEKQGKFWPMYDQLYTHQDNLTPPVILSCAAAAGLDVSAFKKADRSREVMQRAFEQHSMGDQIGMQATPTFLVHKDGTKKVDMYIGLWPQQEFGNRPGLRQLMLNTPWGVTMQPSDIPPPKDSKT